jgi:hypothetical protein
MHSHLPTTIDQQVTPHKVESFAEINECRP